MKVLSFVTEMHQWVPFALLSTYSRTAVKSDTYYVMSVCLYCASAIRHKNRVLYALYYIVICGLYCCVIFSTLSHKLHDFRKRLLNIRYVFSLSQQPLSEKFLIMGEFREIL
jgi:hypothetical protein